MKFVNRELELRQIKEAIDLSKNKLFTVALQGLRRIGKTRLLLEVLREEDLYFFVNKNKESQSLLTEYQEILKEKKIINEIEMVRTWDDFFRILFERFTGVLVFDEFQNFTSIDNSVFGILQKQIDLHEKKKGIVLFFSGSTIGLMKKLFSDNKEPLYGRIKRKMNLQPFTLRDCITLCDELRIRNFEEVIELYTLFGGFVKYYVSIEDERLEGKDTQSILHKFFLDTNATLEEEIIQILSLEFGKRAGTYYSILTAIAQGNTKISEIASYLRKKETSLTRQLHELVNYFEIVGVETTVIQEKNLYYIRHPLMNFWFRFFYKHLSLYKRRDGDLIIAIKTQLPSFFGKGFEIVCREFFADNPLFSFSKIGRQWGKIRGAPKGRNTYEIDLVALNEKTKEILFGECKWQDKVNAMSVVRSLSEKAKYVQWHNEEREEHYAVFAKSFSKRIKEFESRKVICYDLKDIEKAMKKVHSVS